jgi:hypothetical protein
MQITVEYEGRDYLALVDPGYSGNCSGPPDTWEPPEAGYVEELSVWDFGTQSWQIVPDTEPLPTSLEDRIWEVAYETQKEGYE